MKPSASQLNRVKDLVRDATEGRADWFLEILSEAGFTQAAIDPKAMKAREIGSLFGATPQAVGLWSKNQGCPRNADGTFDLGAVIAWRIDRIKEEIRASEESPAMERKRNAEAEMREIELARLKGEVIEVEAVKRERLARIAAVKSALELLPKQLPPFLAGRSAREISGELSRKVREILGEFSRE